MSTDARYRAGCYYAGSGRDLGADMAALAANPRAVVVFLPQLVAFMKPVDSARPSAWQRLADSPREADDWYIHLLVGNLELARTMGGLLAPLPWLCFQRGARHARLHRLAWQRLVPTIRTNEPTER